ncbi:hypothetical protein L1987_11144 [Smallanthus sonchifolius]|uniref:Uncharacterized protein n=1 Tax=Smallanthus sonchifolius TaxID=185202 RepID=A0ACB9JAZ5_9ASTR|nr:hypothetical protein L1987_11144 [Smallanthus sonchifolius]
MALLKDFKFKNSEDSWGWKSDKDLAFVVKEVREDLRLAAYPSQGSLPMTWCNWVIPKESTDHLLVSCSAAKDMWRLISSWIKVPSIVGCSSVFEVLSSAYDLQRSKVEKKALISVIMTSF